MSSQKEILSDLSEETLKALRDFALQSGVSFNLQAQDSKQDLIESVSKHFQVQDREEVFPIEYSSKDGLRRVSFTVKGIKKELGQTLQSTGLTIWRAAEHLCQFIIDHVDRFEGKIVCELGAGLGLVSILLEKLCVCSELVVTDGDEDTLQLLIENKIDNEANFETSYLLWGEHEDFLSEHTQLFDIILAADVIYEKEQIHPLLQTVKALLKKDGQFILAFARRNVPIDKVIELAKRDFLFEVEILDDSAEGGKMEPIYSFTHIRTV